MCPVWLLPLQLLWFLCFCGYVPYSEATMVAAVATAVADPVAAAKALEDWVLVDYTASLDVPVVHDTTIDSFIKRVPSGFREKITTRIDFSMP